VLVLSHLTAIAVAAFSLWTLVFIGMPLAFRYEGKLRYYEAKLHPRR
jgi:hypothetical protein